jgi:hypothetical protein
LDETGSDESEIVVTNPPFNRVKIEEIEMIKEKNPKQKRSKTSSLTPKKWIEDYTNYKARARLQSSRLRHWVSKITSSRTIRKGAKQIPSPGQITILKLQNGEYSHSELLGIDTTSARTIEGINNV